MKFFMKTVALFIPNREKRRAFREKFKKRYGDTNYRLDEIDRQLKWMREFMCAFTDITTASPARGNVQMQQAAATRILYLFDIICQEHGLKYWLGAGNLLGLVRHNGMPVPWDDDVDVYMPRLDYEKAMKIFTKIFMDSGLRIFFRGWSLKFVCYKDFPVSFDIFPIDQYSKNLATDVEKQSLLSELNALGSHHPRAKYLEKSGKGHEGDWFKWAWHGKEEPTPPELLDFYDAEKVRFETEIMRGRKPAPDGTLMKGFERSGWGEKGGLFWDYNVVFPVKRAVYNGVTINVPNDTDLYLRSQYGDYWAFPNVFSYSHMASYAKLSPVAIASANEWMQMDMNKFYQGLKK